MHSSLNAVSDLLHDAFETIMSCQCSGGCANCTSISLCTQHWPYLLFAGIESALCREGNVVSSKVGAQIVIMGILNMPVDEGAIPDQDFSVIDSIVEAEPVRAEANVQVELYAESNENRIDRL